MQDYFFKLFGVKGDARYSSKSFRKYGAEFTSRQGNINGVCILGAFLWSLWLGENTRLFQDKLAVVEEGGD